MINNRNHYISELYEAYPILSQIDKDNDDPIIADTSGELL